MAQKNLKGIHFRKKSYYGLDHKKIDELWVRVTLELVSEGSSRAKKKRTRLGKLETCSVMNGMMLRSQLLQYLRQILLVTQGVKHRCFQMAMEVMVSQVTKRRKKVT